MQRLPRRSPFRPLHSTELLYALHQRADFRCDFRY